MAAVSQKIPNLLGGVSQQPDPVKLPGQVREATNVYLDPTFGCRKRPGTEFIATMGSNIPLNARWFNIFRDNAERYAVAMYNNPALVVRVWDLNDGSERTVTISNSAAAYFDGASQLDVEQITIADYTLMTNRNRLISMSGTSSAEAAVEGFVTIDQIAYNTSYNIDISKDTSSTPTKVYTATGLEVIPGSYDVGDGGACSDVDAQNFSVTDGAKTGLNFRLVNQCQAFLGGSDFKESKLTNVNTLDDPDTIFNNNGGGIATETFPGFNIEWDLSYDFDYGWDVYYRVTGTSFERNRIQGTFTGSNGNVVQTSSWEERQGSDKAYRSRYTTDVLLQNGGSGWRKGDETTVTMNGVSFTVRVTEERFTYAYNSAGTASYTSPADTSSGTLDMALVVTSLTTAINNITGFSADSIGNTIRIQSSQFENFNLSCRGGVTSNAMTAIRGVAQDVAELPAQCFPGSILKVNNTEESDSDDYYVRFVTVSEGMPGAGSWEETVAPGILTTLNSSTMPHALVRQADGSFVIDALNTDSAFDGWAPRQVGDEKTNPEPSFVGRSISNMFFFNNRLGFLSEDAVIMSQPGDYFNFFTTSALAVADSDPIDLTASSTRPAILKAAVPTAKGLLLFAERSQFLMSTSELTFAAATVKMTEISNYFYRSNVLPLNTGISVAFISENETYAKVLEMAIDSVDNRPVVADITRVIPEFLPPDFVWEDVTANNNMLFLGDGTENVFVFKFMNNGDKRQMAGWTKWTYPSDILNLSSEDDTLYIVASDGINHSLLKSKLVDDPDIAPIDVGFSQFSPRLDYMFGDDICTITAGASEARVDFPAVNRVFTTEPYVLMVVGGDLDGFFTTVEIQEDATGPFFMAGLDVANSDFVVGVGYTSTVVLPSIFVQQDAKADRVNIPQVSFLYLDLYYSGRYNVTVSKLGYQDVTRAIEITPANVYDANAVPIAEIGLATMPIFSAGNIVKTTIEAPDPYPSAITGYSWEGSYNNRGISALQ